MRHDREEQASRGVQGKYELDPANKAMEPIVDDRRGWMTLVQNKDPKAVSERMLTRQKAGRVLFDA